MPRIWYLSMRLTQTSYLSHMSFLNRAPSDLGAILSVEDGSLDYVGTAFCILGKRETFFIREEPRKSPEKGHNWVWQARKSWIPAKLWGRAGRDWNGRTGLHSCANYCDRPEQTLTCRTKVTVVTNSCIATLLTQVPSIRGAWSTRHCLRLLPCRWHQPESFVRF